MSAASRRVVAATLIAIAVLVLYAGTRRFEFVSFDDPEYVTGNAQVRAGFTADGVLWAFRDVHAANWHPVTWLSHMLDVELLGLAAGRHHMVNVLFHALNAFLLFWLLSRMTGAFWPSVITATLFAVHPLNVESVAWISERKNLLSTMFMLLALLAWTTWARGGRRIWWTASLGLFALGLASKPMLVTFPLILLLLDLWPLRRPLGIIEKLPFLTLSAALGVVTVVAQKSGGAMKFAMEIGFLERAKNAALSYGWYAWKMIVPTGLSVFYPHPASLGEPVSGPATLAGGAFLTLVIVAAVRARLVRPWFTVGAAWFIVTLAPVIGLVQVGVQARADRYAYVPLVGLFICVVWGYSELASRWNHRTAAVTLPVATFVAVLSVMAWKQSQVWRDSGTLFRNALRVDERNWLAWNDLGAWHFSRDERDSAMRAFEKAYTLNPRSAETVYNIAYALSASGRWDAATPYYERAAELAPGVSLVQANLCQAYLNVGRSPDALAACTEALRLAPDSPYASELKGMLAQMRSRS